LSDTQEFRHDDLDWRAVRPPRGCAASTIGYNGANPTMEVPAHEPDRRPPAGGQPRGARCRPCLLRARRKLCGAHQRPDRAQFNAACGLPARSGGGVHGGGGRAAAQPCRGRHRVARPGARQRPGGAAFGLARRDAPGHADRPCGAPRCGPRCPAGTELFPAAGRRHQAGDRNRRSGSGVGSHRAGVSHRRKRHAGAGRGDPAGGYLRPADGRAA